jgi:hypothetical protein
MAAFQNLQLRTEFTSLSPVIDNVSLHLSYYTSFATATVSDVSDLMSHVAASFNAIPTGGVAKPGSYLGPVLSRATNSTIMQAYDVTAHLDGSTAGSPVVMTSFTLPASTITTQMPEGVCATITLQAPYGTDVEFAPKARPRARDRGRIYFGPLYSTITNTEASTNRSILNANVMGDLTKWLAAISVYTTPTNSIVYNLSVWSRKNALMKKAQEAWVDDRPDYQRRRADQGVAKTIIALP